MTKIIRNLTLLLLLALALPCAAVEVDNLRCDAITQKCERGKIDVPGVLSQAEAAETEKHQRAVEAELATIAASDMPDDARAAALIADHEATLARLGSADRGLGVARKLYAKGKVAKLKKNPPKGQAALEEALKTLLQQQPD